MRRANKMKVAMWIAKINNAPDFELKYQYAKLLLTILEEGVLLGPFVDEPPADLSPLPEEYSVPNIVEVLVEQKERRGGSGDRPPVMTEVSSDLKEYAAAQLIPKFGVHCYYAVSDEPLSEWRQAGDTGGASSTGPHALPGDKPRTECDLEEEVHRADCTLCPVTGSFLDDEQAGFQWMEDRPQQYYSPLGTDATSPQTCPPCSPATQISAPPQRSLRDYGVKPEQIFKESPTARGLSLVPRPSPYTTSQVPAYGRTTGSQPRIGEESLFPDLFTEDQSPQETTMSLVRRLRQQQAEGRDRSRSYQAEVDASDRRTQVMKSRTSRTPAPTAAPTAASMTSPYVAHSAPQPQTTPTSRPINQEWSAVLPQFPDLFGQGPSESPITQIARRLQQQSDESRERTRRRVAHREQRVRDRELMLQQATAEAHRSMREPPEAATTDRFQEEQSSAAQLMEECIQECSEEVESRQSSPQAATEESSPETSYEFPSPIWSSSTKAEPSFGPSRGYGDARYHTPSHRSQVKTEESSPESSYELASSAWSSSRRTDAHKYVSTPAYGEERYRTPAQRACSPCGTESSESSPEPLPPPLWSSSRREQSGPAPGPARRPTPWDTY